MLAIEALCKTYGQRTVLDRLSLHLQAGEIYGLLGPNGAGKTTTINILCQVLAPDSGQIALNGEPLRPTRKNWLGVAPQDNLLYRQLTVAENLHFFAQIYGLDRQQRRRRVAASLAAVNLGDRAHSRVETLSGGMQRRANIAAAIVHQPKLLILDEPTTGLDLESRYEIWALIRHLQAQGMTILLTTHLLDEAERLCERIGILKSGRIVAEGTLAELQQYVAACEIVVLTTPDEPGAIARAESLGYPQRRYGSDLAFWLPEELTLTELVARFEGI
ncbi:MAG: ABC transporter ATP-binding protein, partial [Spirulinaceae cyanobacterium RM2_2_10]|nr:ABC transporter ATP-binding protein [Spirulinaceae cyanobacterium RM2_2_10]